LDQFITLRTRGSAALDKAQRRLATLKAIDDSLDLGHGLTISSYAQMIASTRAAIEAHNTLVSNIDASRQHVTALETALSDMSGRMLTGVATKYGKTSTEYRKAGGSARKSNPSSPQAKSLPEPEVVPTILIPVMTNGNGASSANQPV
jgi:hypothetical protein